MNKEGTWYKLLQEEFKKDYMIKLSQFLEQRRVQTIVYPESKNVFNAYNLTPYEDVKVCIIGQDPYIKPNEAHGLSFSTECGKGTPSLRQIEKAVRAEMEYDKHDLWDNNLTRWADQGVFLLNTVLTVDAGVSNSHAGKGWEWITFKTIMELDKREDVIFLLWGKSAHAFDDLIMFSKVIMCEHPVAASYQGRTWRNNECFLQVNDLLTTKINW